MAKNKKTIYWIIGIIILILILNYLGIFKTTFFSIESTSVKFRTASLDYSGAIAYGTTCDGVTLLTKFAMSPFTDGYPITCSEFLATDSRWHLILPNLPGGWKTGGTFPQLWGHVDFPTYLYVCDDNGSAISIERYTPSSTAVVSDSPQPINSSMEVPCFQTCNTPADTNCDNIVSRDELGIYISNWVVGTVTRDDLGLAIVAWVSSSSF